MLRNLYDEEIKWINKMLDVDIKGKEILMQQICCSKVICEHGYDYLSLKFKVEESAERYPYDIRVPIEMRTFSRESVPVLFLLHIIDGIIDELELITADSSKINLKKIDFENVEYVINKNII